jgi:hypothetical protein
MYCKAWFGLLIPNHADAFNRAIGVTQYLIIEITYDTIQRRLYPYQLPFVNAFGRARGAVGFGMGNRAAQHQRLVSRGERAVVARVEAFLLALCRKRCGKGECGGCGGKDQGSHPPVMPRGHENERAQKKRAESVSAPAL